MRKDQTIDELIEEWDKIHEPPPPKEPSKPLVAGKKLRAIPFGTMMTPLIAKKFGG